MIRFENQNGRKDSRGNRMWDIDVRLDGKIVGTIKSCATGFYYVPKGCSRTRAETFETLAECKESLLS